MARIQESVAVSVRIPRDLVADVEVSQLAKDLRQPWAIEQVRLRRLGVGRGAEIAEMPRAAFMQLLGEHGVPVIDYPLEDLRDELKHLDGR